MYRNQISFKAIHTWTITNKIREIKSTDISIGLDSSEFIKENFFPLLFIAPYSIVTIRYQLASIMWQCKKIYSTRFINVINIVSWILWLGSSLWPNQSHGTQVHYWENFVEVCDGGWGARAWPFDLTEAGPHSMDLSWNVNSLFMYPYAVCVYSEIWFFYYYSKDKVPTSNDIWGVLRLGSSPHHILYLTISFRVCLVRGGSEKVRK